MHSDESLEEAWCPVRQAPRYEVSNTGRVRRIDTGRVLSLSPRANGYVSVALVIQPGASKRFYVHRLVADAFCGGVAADREVNHINFVRSDNRAWNLEVVTREQNTGHSRKAGRYAMNGKNSPCGDQSVHSKLSSHQVGRIFAERAGGRRVKEIAEEMGISRRHVYSILSGASWKKIGREGIGSYAFRRVR